MTKNAGCAELKKLLPHVKSRIEIATLGEDTDPDTGVWGRSYVNIRVYTSDLHVCIWIDVSARYIHSSE